MHHKYTNNGAKDNDSALCLAKVRDEGFSGVSCGEFAQIARLALPIESPCCSAVQVSLYQEELGLSLPGGGMMLG